VHTLENWEKGENQLPSIKFTMHNKSPSFGSALQLINSNHKYKFNSKSHRFFKADPFESDKRLLQLTDR
jgi:hypothetical protein